VCDHSVDFGSECWRSASRAVAGVRVRARGAARVPARREAARVAAVLAGVEAGARVRHRQLVRAHGAAARRCGACVERVHAQLVDRQLPLHGRGSGAGNGDGESRAG